ncbi:methyltransferase domain-containing protein [Dactylosporangium vinaceum]|uniref:SAM-dependent methyltransferase n=1 Tax=Dactylosporangium vinaceum TaxID=53362 RepID=A0ABV5MSP4_9ACTN|nr:methyltransferase domain-containing protein [Dactylosporangium vinaceum]UAC00960.1 methyltransferase domain-containing protein [Dactylosporangium vinaceum]
MSKVRAQTSVFDYMQGYTLCTVMSALEELGVLDALAADGLRAEQIGSNEFLTRATLRYLTERGIVAEDGDRVRLTEFGRTIYADRGYLVWLSGGYGEAMTALGDLLTGRRRFGEDIDRNVRWVAVGSAEIGQKDMWPYVVDLARRFKFQHIADLGCGNAHYLISLCQEVGARGIGVDISPASCKEAEQEVAKAGLTDRISIIEADAGDLQKVPGIDGVDLVFTFFFLHEVLEHGFDVLVAYLRQIQQSLPAGAHMLTAEVAPPGCEADGVELFTPEYALTQALMEQRLLGEDGWRKAFTEAGFEIVDVVTPDLPEARIYLARKP